MALALYRKYRPATFADFGIEAPDLGFVSVEDQGSVEFLLRLTI